MALVAFHFHFRPGEAINMCTIAGILFAWINELRPDQVGIVDNSLLFTKPNMPWIEKFLLAKGIA